ncbi:MAG: nicotinate-nucleotide diphosphorylase (carboxylating) [Actinobacteria bacterium 13_1_20CM_3_71_11]|nr:MAG: nicotinate-nucleotide diphosphorylase (carboxylating) [Actinobacteria bacterium 13_1_20CM_3_71_11]
MSTGMSIAGLGLDPAAVAEIIERALAEDLGPQRIDVTSAATIPAGQTGVGELVARADGVVAGLPVAGAVFTAVSPTVTVRIAAAEGQRVSRGDVLATVEGPTRAHALAGTGATVLDTRKTTPGLRILEKYAVRAGGGTNKRMGLYDVGMVKDNHKLAAGSITAAYQRIRAAYPEVPVQVEVTTVVEAVEAVAAGATFLLCDNMTPALLREVVAAVAGRAELEATGGLTLAVAREYAQTGVDYLSVGALTHSSPILDIALDLQATG